MTQTPTTVEVNGPTIKGAGDIFTPAALDFLAALHQEFYVRRRELLAARDIRRGLIEHGQMPGFKPQGKHIREDAGWRVIGTQGAPGLERRTVELSSPVTPRTAAAALNSDADVWMADLEDGLSPTWENVVTAHIVLRRASRGDFAFQSRSGDTFRAKNPHPPTMIVRPRGWHLPEAHLTWIDEHETEHAASAALVDFGLFFFHNAQALMDRGFGPYLYLPKLESSREARLWNDVFLFAQERLGFAKGTIRASALIESVNAAFQMDEILYELRDHAVGLAAGRWDYVASIVKTYGGYRDFVLPDRSVLSTQLEFVNAFTTLLVQTCHKRGAYALGGMSTDVFSDCDGEDGAAQRVSPAELRQYLAATAGGGGAQPDESEAEAYARVYADKCEEAQLGFDGTWVAHPSLIPVAEAAFRTALGAADNQLTEVPSRAIEVAELLPLGARKERALPTEEGVRDAVRSCLHYFNAWLFGRGQVEVNGRVEDSSTAELSRGLLWQWVNHGVGLADGRKLSRNLFSRIVAEELAVIPRDNYDHFDDAEDLLMDTVAHPGFPGYFTSSAYTRFLVDRQRHTHSVSGHMFGGQTFVNVQAA